MIGELPLLDTERVSLYQSSLYSGLTMLLRTTSELTKEAISRSHGDHFYSYHTTTTEAH